MSKKSKAQSKEKRLKEKRGRKAAKKAQYEAWAREGKNKKSKRTRLSSGRKKSIKNRSHPNGACGNLGCKRCNPILNDPKNASPESCIYRKQFMKHAA